MTRCRLLVGISALCSALVFIQVGHAQDEGSGSSSGDGDGDGDSGGDAAPYRLPDGRVATPLNLGFGVTSGVNVTVEADMRGVAFDGNGSSTQGISAGIIFIHDPALQVTLGDGNGPTNVTNPTDAGIALQITSELQEATNGTSFDHGLGPSIPGVGSVSVGGANNTDWPREYPANAVQNAAEAATAPIIVIIPAGASINFNHILDMHQRDPAYDNQTTVPTQVRIGTAPDGAPILAGPTVRDALEGMGTNFNDAIRSFDTLNTPTPNSFWNWLIGVDAAPARIPDDWFSPANRTNPEIQAEIERLISEELQRRMDRENERLNTIIDAGYTGI